MSYADEIFVKNIQDILDNGVWDTDYEVRPRWEDGTPAHTIKKFGLVNRYDLSKELPILTLRKTNFVAAIDEILWIWQKKSNNIKDLHSHIWDSWADENGSIGKAYGYQLAHEFAGDLRDGIIFIANVRRLHCRHLLIGGRRVGIYAEQKGIERVHEAIRRIVGAGRKVAFEAADDRIYGVVVHALEPDEGVHAAARLHVIEVHRHQPQHALSVFEQPRKRLRKLFARHAAPRQRVEVGYPRGVLPFEKG